MRDKRRYELVCLCRVDQEEKLSKYVAVGGGQFLERDGRLPRVGRWVGGWVAVLRGCALLFPDPPVFAIRDRRIG
jgi:hypothetical protein